MTRVAPIFRDHSHAPIMSSLVCSETQLAPPTPETDYRMAPITGARFYCFPFLQAFKVGQLPSTYISI